MKGKRAVIVTYRCTHGCRKAPGPSCGDRSAKRHAKGAEIISRTEIPRERQKKSRPIQTKKKKKGKITNNVTRDVPEAVYRHDDKRKWSGTIRDSGKVGD